MDKAPARLTVDAGGGSQPQLPTAANIDPTQTVEAESLPSLPQNAKQLNISQKKLEDFNNLKAEMRRKVESSSLIHLEPPAL